MLNDAKFVMPWFSLIAMGALSYFFASSIQSSAIQSSANSTPEIPINAGIICQISTPTVRDGKIILTAICGDQSAVIADPNNVVGILNKHVASTTCDIYQNHSAICEL